MSRVAGKTALITGASAGIGAASARRFAQDGANLVLVARRLDRVSELCDTLASTHGVTAWAYPLDVRDLDAVKEFARRLEQDQIGVDILLNNAGLARGLSALHEGDVQDWEEMIDTNLKGLLYMSRTFIPGMVERNSGHVVNIGSIAGHMVYPSGNVYNATKFGVKALTQGMSVDLVGTAVRVSSVDPGLVETEFSEVRFRGDSTRAAAVYEGYRPLRPEDVADAISYVVNAPPHVNVLDLLIMPTDQRNAYVIHKDGA